MIGVNTINTTSKDMAFLPPILIVLSQVMVIWSLPNCKAWEKIILRKGFDLKGGSHSSPYVKLFPEKKAKEMEGEYCPF